MLKLILGGSGSGKTRLLEELIKKDCQEGKKSLLIVPEQQTVACEHRMLDILPPSAQLDFEVLNFTRLANKAFRQYGGLTYRYVTSGVKSLAMWNTLRTLSPLLSEYGGGESSSDMLSLTELMLSAVEEFKAYCISPSALDNARKKLPSESRLASKISDISLVYAAYNNALSGYGDGSDDISKLAEIMRKHPFLENYNIYVDSFTSFTAAEYEVLAYIMKRADSLTVALCMDSDCDEKFGQMQFETVAMSARKLCRIAEKQGVDIQKELIEGNHRAKNRSLELLGPNLWRFDAPCPLDDTLGELDNRAEAVTLLRCGNKYEEALAAANTVCQLIREGMRFRDIVIIARDASLWEGIIDTALEKAEIPYFMSHKTDIISKPLVKMLLCALKIKNNGWRTEDVITYVKTGFCTDNAREADIFTDYVWRWSISGSAYVGDDWTMNPDSYSGELREAAKARLESVNCVRRAVVEPLMSFFSALDSAETNAELCRAIFDFLNVLSISEKLKADAEKKYAEGERKAASESLQLYNTVLSVLDEIAVLETETRYSCQELEQAIKAVLSGVSIGSIPTSCDEVIVGSASMFRASAPKCVILIGVNDGIFPESVKEDILFTDEDRKMLGELGLEMSGSSDERSSEELFYIYRAVTAPSDKLVVTYSTSELQGGEELKPSIAFNRIRLLLDLPIIDYSKLPPEDKIQNPNTAFEYVALLGGTACGKALEKYFADSEKYGAAYKALKIPVSDSECQLSKEMADRIFGSKMSISPSALEKYVKCHFDYFCEYVLRLRGDNKNEYQMNSTGSIIHAVLEKFICEVTDENGFNAELAEARSDELAEKILAECTGEIIPVEHAETARMKHTVSKLKNLSRLLIKSVIGEFKSSRFVPSFFELKINERDKGSVKPINFTLKDGTTVTLGGIVDRVDIYRKDKDVYVKVVDYKTGAKEFKLSEVNEGINLQMLLYLQALCNNDSAETRALLGCSEGGKLMPAGVVYLSSKIPRFSIEGSVSSDEVYDMAEDLLKRTGVVNSDADILYAMCNDGKYKYVLSGLAKPSGDTKRLKSNEDFAYIFAALEQTVVSVASSLRCGDARVCPREDDNRLPCEYCSMHAVCRMNNEKKSGESNEEVRVDGMD